MPATSVAQREAIAIAEHHPEKLYARNKSLLAMKPSDQHDFAATPEKGLPQHVGQGPKKSTAKEQYDLPGHGSKKQPADKTVTRLQVAKKTKGKDKGKAKPGSPAHRRAHMGKVIADAHRAYQERYGMGDGEPSNPYNNMRV